MRTGNTRKSLFWGHRDLFKPICQHRFCLFVFQLLWQRLPYFGKITSWTHHRNEEVTCKREVTGIFLLFLKFCIKLYSSSSNFHNSLTRQILIVFPVIYVIFNGNYTFFPQFKYFFKETAYNVSRNFPIT